MTIGVSPTYITGMGAVTALGVGVSELWQGLRLGQSGVKPIVIPRTERQQIGQAAHLGNFNPTDHIAPDLAAATDRFVHFAIVAADEAMKQAGWPIGRANGRQDSCHHRIRHRRVDDLGCWPSQILRDA